MLILCLADGDPLTALWADDDEFRLAVVSQAVVEEQPGPVLLCPVRGEKDPPGPTCGVGTAKRRKLDTLVCHGPSPPLTVLSVACVVFALYNSNNCLSIRRLTEIFSCYNS